MSLTGGNLQDIWWRYDR